jgi:hypothetical protein
MRTRMSSSFHRSGSSRVPTTRSGTFLAGPTPSCCSPRRTRAFARGPGLGRPERRIDRGRRRPDRRCRYSRVLRRSADVRRDTPLGRALPGRCALAPGAGCASGHRNAGGAQNTHGLTAIDSWLAWPVEPALRGRRPASHALVRRGWRSIRSIGWMWGEQSWAVPGTCRDAAGCGGASRGPCHATVV